MKYPDKNQEMIEVDRKCGCQCHQTQGKTQNFMWCGKCHSKHVKDPRYPKGLTI